MGMQESEQEEEPEVPDDDDAASSNTGYKKSGEEEEEVSIASSVDGARKTLWKSSKDRRRWLAAVSSTVLVPLPFHPPLPLPVSLVVMYVGGRSLHSGNPGPSLALSVRHGQRLWVGD